MKILSRIVLTCCFAQLIFFSTINTQSGESDDEGSDDEGSGDEGREIIEKCKKKMIF